MLLKASLCVVARAPSLSCLSQQRVLLHVMPWALACFSPAAGKTCLASDVWGLNQHYGCHCGFTKGGRVTMWCPVFSQTEDKVGVSALTESRTCFRPFTDHAAHTLTPCIHKPHTEPRVPDT